ncbi:hypothetical protein ACH4LN_05265 [Streptomyces albus]|uniref:hypothetical protein n=1 Tax=Streptomyces TaxID=1883 RepID=UPI00034E2E66|nr:MULTISPECIES: hypothetical protein [Streptomyces]EPD89849.1 hypothetical protein HMPREF1486_06160 [Streptomyces sp. HPH0547]KPC96629.1 hypothetical protein ADL27_01905 [Streptomyces sp. NRRL F-6602]QID37501.1 hypothetical protein G3260_003952 [Streptomyces albus]
MAGDGGDGKGAAGGKGPAPGEGYAVEIAEVRKVMTPLEESVVAAHKIKDDWKKMAGEIDFAATVDIEKPAKDVLSKWGFGMGRIAQHTDDILVTLRQVLSAYVMADLLRIKDFSPTEDNMAKLPVGDHGLEVWREGHRGKFDPAPKSLQEQWDEEPKPKEAPRIRRLGDDQVIDWEPRDDGGSIA